jgi:hypothetical protein
VISAESDELVSKIGSQSSLGCDFVKTGANESFAVIYMIIQLMV